ncbi:MAG: formate/nitrite transporter family protein [Anaerolineae bacterium]
MSFKKPAEIIEAVCTISKTKTETEPLRLLVLGFLAGAYIAFGGTVAIATGKGITSPELIGLSKLVFGGTFPVGLMLVIIAGSELFTGNTALVPPGCYKGVSKWSGLVKNWVLVYIGNLIGSVFLAYLCYASGIFAKDPFLGGVKSIADGKVTLTFAQAFWRGVGCNWLVCLAVWLAVSAEDIAGKILGIWFPIMAFVAIGFEHSIANMYFIPLGIFYGATKANWVNFFTANLLPVTIGNIIGGGFFVGTIYWWLYGRK